jgi:hypothetical protein
MNSKKDPENRGPRSTGREETFSEGEDLELDSVEGRDRGAVTGREQGAEVNQGAGAYEKRTEEQGMSGVTQDRDRVHRSGERSGEPINSAHQAGWQPESGEEIRQQGHTKEHPEQGVHRSGSIQQRQAEDSFLGGKSHREGGKSVSHAAQQRAGLTPGGGNQRTAQGQIDQRSRVGGQSESQRGSQQQPSSKAGGGKGQRQQGLGDRSYGGGSHRGDRDKGHR